MRLIRLCTVAATLFSAVSLTGQGELAPEVLLLARIKLHMAEILEKLPNYTCLETVERSRRRAANKKYELIDSLRLEVAYVERKEMFAWPGAGKFEEREFREFVPGGAFGNGNFALHARSVFLSNAASFSYESETVERNRRLVRFQFRIPQVLSGYSIRVGEAEAIVGYHGFFQADAGTLDLVRLQVIADELPPQLQLSEATDTLEYGRQRIGDTDFLLPLGSELRMIDMRGNEVRNRIVFSGCRQYAGESFLSFADPPPDSEPAPLTPVEVQLPAGIVLEVELEAPLDLRTAAIGDPVIATVLRGVRKQGKTLVDKGARLSGRIHKLDRTRSSYFAVGFTFGTLEFGGKRAGIASRVEDAGPFFGLYRANRNSVVQDNTLAVRSTHPMLPAGFRLVLQTIPISNEAKQ